jgi:hypothetical protein
VSDMRPKAKTGGAKKRLKRKNSTATGMATARIQRRQAEFAPPHRNGGVILLVADMFKNGQASAIARFEARPTPTAAANRDDAVIIP